MGFIEVVCNSKTAEYSSETTGFYTSVDTPVFSFGSGLDKRLKGIKVTEVILPYSWYNWWNINYYPNPRQWPTVGASGLGSTGLFSLRIEDTTGPTTYFFNPALPSTVGGNYTATELCSEINTIINSLTFTNSLTAAGCVGPYTNTCTYNTKSGRMEVSIACTSTVATCDVQFFVRPPDGITIQTFDQRGESLPAAMTGLTQWNNYFTRSATGFTFISPYPLNMHGSHYVTLRSQTLGTLFRIQPNFYEQLNWYRTDVRGETDQLAIVPLENHSFGENIVWKNEDRAGFFKVSSSTNLATFDLYFTLGPFGHKLRLNGQGFTVKFLVEVDDVELDQIVSEY